MFNFHTFLLVSRTDNSSSLFNKKLIHSVHLSLIVNHLKNKRISLASKIKKKNFKLLKFNWGFEKINLNLLRNLLFRVI